MMNTASEVDQSALNYNVKSDLLGINLELTNPL